MKNGMLLPVSIASVVCFLGFTGCAGFNAGARQKRRSSYVEIGPKTYNTESHNFERPWPFGPESNQQ